jgi:hypothetical protein
MAGFTPGEFGVESLRQITYGESIDFSYKGLNDESLKNFAEGLLDLFERRPDEVRFTSLNLNTNYFGNVGLGHLANALKQLPSVMESLERLNVSGNKGITTLSPLVGAGVFESLEELAANSCSLSAIPAELCANLPKIVIIQLNYNDETNTIVLTPQALQSLPPECVMTVARSKVIVDAVTLPTGRDEEFDGFGPGFGNPRTVAEFMEYARVEPAGFKTKSARKRTSTAARCGACASASPRFKCSGCHQEVYCGVSCQKKDWSKHQTLCGSNSDWITTQGEGVANEDKILLNLIFNGERSYWSFIFEEFLNDPLFEPIFAFFGNPSTVRQFDFEKLRDLYGENATLTSVTQQIWNENFPPPEFKLEKALGAGTYGTVYRARDYDTDELYAVKIFKNLERADIYETVTSEASLMQFVNPIHPLTKERGNDHVIAFFGFWDAEGGPILISELVDGLDLQSYFMEEGFEQRTDRWFRLENAIPGIFDGLAYLHSKGIAHRDIKPDNIMLELPSGRPVLIDLGLSCAFGSQEDIARRLLEKWSCDTGGRGDPETSYQNMELGGAPAYNSPEMALVFYNNLTSENKVYAEIETQQRNDLWAVGLTVLDCVLAPAGTFSFVQFGVQGGSIEQTLRSVALIDKEEEGKENQFSREKSLLRIRGLVSSVGIPDSLFQKIRLIEDILLNFKGWTAALVLDYLQN